MRFFLFFIPFLFPHFLQAHEAFLPGIPQPGFERIGVREGLSFSQVNDIVQDQYGFIWIATVNGLNRYDGHTFRVFTKNDESPYSLPDNHVKSLHPDNDGHIWLVLQSGELVRFNTGKETFKPYPLPSNQTAQQNSATINQVFWDAKGRNWIATSQGVYTYRPDSDTIQRISSGSPLADKLLNQQVNVIFQDNQKNIWFGTDEGVVILDAASNKYFHLANESDNHYSLSNNTVRQITQYLDDHIWIGTGYGLNRLQKYPIHEGELIDYRVKRYLFQEVLPAHERRKGILSLETDHSGNLWIGTNLGLSLLRRGKEDPADLEHFFYNETYLDHLGINRIGTIFTDSRNFVWFFSETKPMGLGMYNPDADSFYFHRHVAGNPWSLSGNKAEHIMEDSSGNLWISSLRAGLNKLDLYSNTFGLILPIPGDVNSINAADVYSIYHDHQRKTLWVGTINGLNQINLKDGSIKVFEYQPNSNRHLSANLVGAITPDPEGFLWIGYYDYKLSKFWPEKGIFEHYNYHPGQPEKTTFKGWSVRAALVDSNSNVWLATGIDGLFLYNRATRNFESIQIQVKHNGTVTDFRTRLLIEIGEGQLLIGSTHHGLVLLNIHTREYTHYFHEPLNPASISSNYVTNLFKDSNGDIWIATDNGLNQFDHNKGTFRYFENPRNPESNFISSIAGDKTGNLWLATADGIFRFSPSESTFSEFFRKNAVLQNEFNRNAVHWSDAGVIYFGGNGGVVCFIPEEMIENPHQPNVELIGLNIRNQRVLPGKEKNGQMVLSQEIFTTSKLVLNHRNNDFSIGFTALHFTSPDQNHYAFKLENFDPEWKYTDASNRWATYTNLSPGRYTFRVIASNNNNLWNTTGRTLEIIIKPAWHQTYLFRLFIAISLLVSIAVFYRLRTQQLRARKKELETLVDLRTAEIMKMDRMKTNFFTNLSHEIRTPLTLITSPLDKIIEDGEVSDKTARNLRIIRRNAYRLLKVANQLLDFRRVEAGKLEPINQPADLYLFLTHILELFEPFSQKKDLKMELTTNFKALLLDFDQDILEKILFNLLSNSIKNTHEGGNIMLEAMVQHKDEKSAKLLIKVRDNGKGIEESDIKNIFNNFYQTSQSTLLAPNSSGIGLAYTHELVELLKGNISAKSEPGKGTEITLELTFTKGQAESINYNTSAFRYTMNALAIEEHLNIPSTAQTHEVDASKPLLLIVEDDMDLARFLFESLKDDYAIIKAENGKAGLDVAMEEIPDLIISDLMMPVMDGYQLCEHLKNDPRTSHIPLILLTAKSSDDSKLKGLTKGAEAYIGKPFNLEILKAQIHTILLARKNMQQQLRNNGWAKVEDVNNDCPNQHFTEKLVSLIEERITEDGLDADLLAEELNMSKSQLYRKVKAITGLSVHLFIRDLKLMRAAKLLKGNAIRISEVAYRVGFNNVSYFTRCFTQKFGESPSEYVRNKIKQTG